MGSGVETGGSVQTSLSISRKNCGCILLALSGVCASLLLETGGSACASLCANLSSPATCLPFFPTLSPLLLLYYVSIPLS